MSEVNYGVPVEDYILGLAAELAATTDSKRKAAIQAELDAVNGVSQAPSA